MEKRKRYKDMEQDYLYIGEDYSSIDEESSDTILDNSDDVIEDNEILNGTKGKKNIRFRKNCSGMKTAK